jgi:predicted dehydrogenase
MSNNMSEKLRIVLVGCGGISDQWFRAAAKIADAELVGLVDLQLEAAQRRKDEYKLTNTRIGTDVETMLLETHPDIVFDCTVPVARASVVNAALKHGCHVLSEKPMANSMDEARQLVQAAKKANRTFAIMQNRRYNPNIRSLRAFLGSGAVGDVTTVNGDFYLGVHFGGFRDKMKHVLLLDMAIHSFDQARLILDADPVAVYCHEWNPRGSWYDHDASAIAVFEMGNGIVFTYRGSWCAEGLSTSWECDWRVVGSKGSVAWDGGGEFHAQTPSATEGFVRPVEDLVVPLIPATAEEGHVRCILDFVDCVRTGRVPETVCTENIKSLAMVFGAIESAETKQRVVIKI